MSSSFGASAQGGLRSFANMQLPQLGGTSDGIQGIQLQQPQQPQQQPQMSLLQRLTGQIQQMTRKNPQAPYGSNSD